MSAFLQMALSNIAVAGLLAILAWLVGRWQRRPALTHALWLLVLVKLMTPPLVTLPLPTWPTPTAEVAEPAPIEIPVDLPVALEELWVESAEPAPVAVEPPVAWDWLEPTLLAVWFAGSVMWFGMVWIRRRRFQRWLACAEPASLSIREQALALADRMDIACPRVVATDALVSPLLWVWGRSAYLLLPRELMARLTPEQTRAILAHELAHWKRGDHWIRRLELCVLGIYWWNPLAWWARKQLQDAEEECCDACVVAALPESARAYALALVETLDFLSSSRPSLPVGASGVGELPSLQRRLSMILSAKPQRSMSLLGTLVLGALGLALLPWAPTFAQEGERPKRPESKETPDRKKTEEKPAQRVPGKETPDRKKNEEKPAQRPPDREITPEMKAAMAELEKARLEAEKARKAFEEKFRELKGKLPEGVGGPFPNRRPEGQPGIRPIPGGQPGQPGIRPFPGSDLDKRMNELERKLDILIHELSKGKGGLDVPPRPPTPPAPPGKPDAPKRRVNEPAPESNRAVPQAPNLRRVSPLLGARP